MFRTFAGLLLVLSAAAASACPALLEHELRRLRSSETVDLCERYAGRALLIVNTASHCGFTPQFTGLEALHREYAGRGLAVLGFPSDDFRQEAGDEGEVATVCYVNYGVTFDMFAPIGVRGEGAHPLFKALAAASAAPGWNFYKYVVDRDGRVVGNFTSRDRPDSERLRAAIESAL